MGLSEPQGGVGCVSRHWGTSTGGPERGLPGRGGSVAPSHGTEPSPCLPGSGCSGFCDLSLRGFGAPGPAGRSGLVPEPSLVLGCGRCDRHPVGGAGDAPLPLLTGPAACGGVDQSLASSNLYPLVSRINSPHYGMHHMALPSDILVFIYPPKNTCFFAPKQTRVEN